MKKNIVILITGVFIASLVITYFVNFKFRNWATLIYYSLKNDNFDKGDSMYAYKELFYDKQNQAIPLFRLMRPLSITELQKIDRFSRLDINVNEKEFYDSSSKPVMVFCYSFLVEDKMHLQRSALIGTYTGSQIEDVLTKDFKKVKNTFYSFIPNKNVFEIGAINYRELPVNFTWVDNDFYILPEQVSKNETLK